MTPDLPMLAHQLDRAARECGTDTAGWVAETVTQTWVVSEGEHQALCAAVLLLHRSARLRRQGHVLLASIVAGTAQAVVLSVDPGGLPWFLQADPPRHP